MVRRIKVKVAAKVNLSLNITGRANGYHLLDSVFASVALYDTVTVAERLDGKVRTEFSDGTVRADDNRVVAAVQALQRRFGSFGVDIIVQNAIPSGGGLGGSSADAAGVLRALDAMYDFSARGADLAAIAAEVGSDVPFMLRGGFARVRGRGELVRFFDARPDKKLVLVTPGLPVSTPACFAEFDRRGDAGIVADVDAMVDALQSGNDFTPYIGNALYASACALNSQVQDAVSVLQRAGGKTVMTGSGSSCLGLFDRLPDPLPGMPIAFANQGILFL